ncbi:arsenate reductase family protein [Celeribacter arenosi]|uniref:Arsenate reductase n=1 Tax=Celeribacter arenosi TaxID=792649 RepID=A0ABP7K9A6_9RHOB
MKVYGIKACDTCRKAVKTLGVALHDVRETPLTRDELSGFFAEFGDRLLNTRSTTWRGLSDEEKAKAPIDLMLAYPTLMKRPVIDVDGTLYLGWAKDVQAALSGE